MLKTWDFKCDACNHYAIEMFEYEERGDVRDCPNCGGHTYRYIPHINVNTAKLSKSRVDGVEKDKFKKWQGDFRAKVALKREVRKGKDADAIKERAKECVERGINISK